MMRPYGEDLKIYLHRAPIDMRRGRNGCKRQRVAHAQALQLV
jgi:hypothetical protein